MRSRSEPDPLPLSKADNGLDAEAIFETYYDRRSERLGRIFSEPNCSLRALGFYRKAGVFVQACGHYLHLDCYRAYQESVSVSFYPSLSV